MPPLPPPALSVENIRTVTILGPPQSNLDPAELADALADIITEPRAL